METSELDWRLHAPMVFKILNDFKYLKTRGVHFEMKGFTIYRTGGWPYAPSEIINFDAAIKVIHENGGSGSGHWEAICLLEGVSFHRVLDDGRAVLRRLFSNGQAQDCVSA